MTEQKEPSLGQRNTVIAWDLTNQGIDIWEVIDAARRVNAAMYSSDPKVLYDANDRLRDSLYPKDQKE